MICRRGFVSGLGAAGVAAAAAPVRAAAPRRALVHCASEADFVACGLLDGGDPFWHAAMAETVAEQAAQVRALEAAGFAVVQLEDLLTAAIARSREAGRWTAWLARYYPALSGQPVNAATLLGRDGLGRTLLGDRPFALHSGDAGHRAIVALALDGATPRRLSAIALAF